MTKNQELGSHPGKHRIGKFFPLTPDLARELRNIPNMPAGAWRLWSYLVTLEPYGDDYVELPELTDILAECHISKPTFYRAIALFEEHGLFDLQFSKIFARNLRGGRIVSKMRQESQNRDSEFQNCDPESQKRNSESQKRDYFAEEEISNTDQEGNPETVECTNNRRSDLQNNRTVDPSHQPCFEELNREELGTGSQDPLEQEVSALLTLIQDSGIRGNGTIQETIVSLVFQEGSAAARRIVENSVSAVVEQQKKGNCRNPGGMLVAGLRRGFTANGAKRDARERREPTTKPEPEVFGFPIPAPSFNQVAAAIEQALLRGDRTFALEKLQNLWVQGFQDLVEELVITFKRDWQFRLTNQGVQECTS